MSKQSIARQRIAEINGIGRVDLTEAFTKQHYIKIAAILKKKGGLSDVANELADMFAEDNSRFDRARFLAACGA